MRQRFGNVWDLESIEDIRNNTDHNFVDDFNVRTMAHLIGKPLTDGRLKYRNHQQPIARTVPSQVPMKPIVQITGHDGSIIHQKWDGKDRSKIRVRQLSCFICHQ